MPKGKRLFYTPAAIRDVAGVTHRPLDERTDVFIGTADDLALCGVVPPEQLPPPEAGSITWQPTARPSDDRCAPWCPGYLHVMRLPNGGRYRAVLTVSLDEQRRRKAAAAAAMEQLEARLRVERLQGTQPPVDALKSAEDLRTHARQYCEHAFTLLAQAFNLANEDYHPHMFTADVRLRVCKSLEQIKSDMESGEILGNLGYPDFMRKNDRLHYARRDVALQAMLQRIESAATRGGRL